MDKDFIEKLNSLGEWNQQEKNNLEADFTIAFSNEEDSVIKVTTEKGEFIYELKPIRDLYMQKPENKSSNHYLSLLEAIEGAIKRYSSENYDVTDSQLIGILDKLSMKPELEINDPVAKEINKQIKFELSMSGYSRDDLRQAIRKILKSAQKLANHSNNRSYIDFISSEQKS
jgi:hypothetical protein